MPKLPYARASARAPLPSIYQSLDVTNRASALAKQPELSKAQLRLFQRLFADTERLRDCGRPGFYPCDSWLCSTCSPKRQRALRKIIRKAIKGEHFPTVIVGSFTIASQPSRRAARQLDDLARVTASFTGNKFLSRKFNGVLRTTEFTLTANGPHWHQHFIFVSRKHLSPSEVEALTTKLRDHWLHVASVEGISATPWGQCVEQARGSLWKQVNYATKQHTQRLSGSPLSLSPGDITALSARGDADALKVFNELEHVSTKEHRRNMYSTSGVFRASATRSLTAQRRVVKFE